jgi:hypothetical protein
VAVVKRVCLGSREEGEEVVVNKIKICNVFQLSSQLHFNRFLEEELRPYSNHTFATHNRDEALPNL